MSNQFCSSCGEKMPSGSQFCQSCGQPTKQSVQQTPEITEMSTSPQATPTRKNKNIIYVGIAAIVAIFAYFTFVSPGPEKVAKSFVNHYGSYEFEKLQKLVSSNPDSWLYDEIEWILEEKREYPREFQENIKYAKDEGYMVKNFTVLNNDQTKDTSYITGRVTLENGDRETVYLELVKESGKWKVYAVD